VELAVLYPKGRVSPLQERQNAGLGGNIRAFAVEGSFDDCQAMVKAAFADSELQARFEMTSANSINIARLLPQACYYAASSGARPGAALSVPSGNFGNLTAGLYARSMGAPVGRFVAATNINKTVPDYLETGDYRARLSQATISNAMDVGAPSNFERMQAHWNLAELRDMILGASVTDDETRETIVRVFKKTGYCLDPHGAVGWCGAEKALPGSTQPVVVLATAHPAKFAEVLEPLGVTIPRSAVLEEAMKKTPQSTVIKPELAVLKEYL
jgi:threonine synthase